VTPKIWRLRMAATYPVNQFRTVPAQVGSSAFGPVLGTQAREMPVPMSFTVDLGVRATGPGHDASLDLSRLHEPAAGSPELQPTYIPVG